MLKIITSVLGILGSFFFSLYLLLGDKFIMAWLSMELAMLFLIPGFFVICIKYGVNSLFSLLIVMGISSGLVMMGVIYPPFFFFLFLGFFVKFGLFPFVGWLYEVFSNSNWLMILILSVFLKSVVIIMAFCAGGSLSCVEMYQISCMLTLIFLSVVFWVFTKSWFHCWCHMTLASSSVLLVIALCDSIGTLFFLYLAYSVWASICMYYFHVSKGICSKFAFFLYFTFLMVTTPISIVTVYKLITATGVFSCTFYFVLCWVLYSMSEQLYLVKYVTSVKKPKSFSDFSDLV